MLEMILRSYTYVRGGRKNRPSLYADVMGNPREDSHIRVILVGKLK